MVGASGAGRLPLGTTGWLVWEHFAVRGTGFPLEELTTALDASGEAPDEPHPALVDLARTDRVVMALLWQNPRIVEFVIEPLARAASADGPQPDARARRRIRKDERTLVRYLQRYHARNESIGFFGPISWGAIAGQGPGITVRPGPQLTDRQEVWFEDWAIDRLAARLARHPDIRPHLPPAPATGALRLGRTLFRAGAAPRRLTDPEVAVLDLVDGRRTAAAITRILGCDASPVLERLVADGVLSLGFDVPLDMHPERALREQLRMLPATPTARQALHDLDLLDATRGPVAAAGSADQLAAALREADEQYRRIVEASPVRTADVAPRGRRLMVSRSRRDVAVTLGPDVLRELAGPLGLVLTSARWFCWAIGELATGWLAESHRELAPLFKPDRVPLSVLCGRLAARLDDPATGPVHDEVANRWARVLGAEPDTARLAASVAGLDDAVAAQFASPVPTWYAGRHHSPDVAIAADGVDAVNGGDYVFVLGELHTGIVTCDESMLNGLPPAPDAILQPAQAALDAGPERFVILHNRSDPTTTGRDYPVPETFSDRYRYLSFGQRAGERAAPAGRRVAASSVVVCAEPDGLSVTLEDGTRHPVLSVVGEFLTRLTGPGFRFLPAWPHSPRVTVDRLVVARETWRIPVDEIALRRGRESDRAARVRAAADRYGLPRHSFWRLDRRQKPVYLDLRSPHLIGLVTHAVNGQDVAGAYVTFTEMLPGPDRLWLADSAGRRYTSELRFTVAEGERAG